MSLIVAAAGSLLGWTTVLGTGIWYWLTVVPDLYEDESPVPFLSVLVLAAVAYLAVVVGAWRRRRGRRDGPVAMVAADFVLGAIVLFTLTTVGIVFMPSLLLTSFASALPGRGKVGAAAE